MLKIGDTVRVLHPFNATFPEKYVITGINADNGAFQILDGIDFDSAYLEKVI